MKLFKNPVIGVILNLLWIGLADIYVGFIGTGLLKMLIPIPVLIFIATFAELTPLPTGPLQFILRLVYFILCGLDGYKTVKYAIDQEKDRPNP